MYNTAGIDEAYLPPARFPLARPPVRGVCVVLQRSPFAAEPPYRIIPQHPQQIPKALLRCTAQRRAPYNGILIPKEGIAFLSITQHSIGLKSDFLVLAGTALLERQPVYFF